jgi:hypothetical protein
VTDVLPSPASEVERTTARPAAGDLAVALAGLASVGAGVVHAGAIGGHAEHPTLARTFAACAIAQVVWGLLALTRPRRALWWLGAVGSLAVVGAWVATRTTGIGFVDGLEAAESPGFADTACAALGFVAAVAAVVVARRGTDRDVAMPSFAPSALGVPALAVAVLAVPALVVSATSTHAHGSAVAPKPYDATLPVDLGGVPGVSKRQRERAEQLVTDTLRDLPRFADVATARAEGYRSIGDALTGFEHYLKWSLVEDDTILDPRAPESLVYKVTPQGRQLVSAMFILPTRYTLETAPDIGGKLTQWHVHDNLCFTPLSVDGSAGGRVVGLTRADGSCAFGQRFTPAAMIHVWITPHACGPFAALEGQGAGQVRAGETRLCDTAHGSH